MAGDKALAHQLCRNEFPQESESNQISEVFIRRKTRTVRVDRHMGGLGESHTLAVV